jgi:hypothetical protein
MNRQPPLLRSQKQFRLAGIALIAGFLALLAFAPLGQLGLPLCGLRLLTGLPCPLCGGTRAAQAFLCGDFSRALYLNPLALPVVGGLIAAALIAAVELIRGRSLADWTSLRNRWLAWTPLLLVLLLLIWWPVHLAGALRQPKGDLLDLRNPVARAAYERLGTGR